MFLKDQSDGEWIVGKDISLKTADENLSEAYNKKMKKKGKGQG